MRIAELIAYVVRIPLRGEFKHASHTRQESDNIIVCCRLGDSTLGWGEGVPRSYVTGETADGAMAQLAATPLTEQLGRECDKWEDVIDLCLRLQPAVAEDDPRGCRANALRCAVELSILDAFGRLFGEPISGVTHRFEPASPLRTSLPTVQYSGAVDAAGSRKEVASALKMRIYGFAHCKVKVGLASNDDPLRLRRIRRWLGRRMDIRLDANEAWRMCEVLAKLEPLMKYNISCVEQPVLHEEVESLAEVRRQLLCPIMLDESLASILDAERAIKLGTCDLFNIRLSKCGGFLNSLKLAAMAHSAGLGYQLGCHPGESGILSAAGRHFATSVRGIRYREGSYDRHLLKVLLTNEDITFGYGGRAPALTAAGTGVTVNRDALARLAYHEQKHSLT